ncbi:zwei Ig domain protein zig-2 [Microplitis mediator]|uniref:zwei Ig domain protein zig-2 n=1 Tax=Microplitis mediator TaxID=375433 RepID=UPI0025556739|nr:zwei Ig domain protein zig-2 [Microplitis mediator]
MEQTIPKSMAGFFFLTLVIQMTATHYISFDPQSPREVANDYDDRPKNVDDSYTNSLTDNIETHHHKALKAKRKPVRITGGPLLLAKGQSGELTCTAYGSPFPQIHWLRGDDLQSQIEKLKYVNLVYHEPSKEKVDFGIVKSKFIVDCASEADKGVIHCVSIINEKVQVASTYIDIDTSSIDLSERCNLIRAPVITNFISSMLVSQDSTVVIPCTVQGEPKPDIVWQTYNGTTITPTTDPRYELLSSGDLLISSLKWVDMDGYVCIAKSKFGEDRQSTFLYPVQNGRST